MVTDFEYEGRDTGGFKDALAYYNQEQGVTARSQMHDALFCIDLASLHHCIIVMPQTPSTSGKGSFCSF